MSDTFSNAPPVFTAEAYAAARKAVEALGPPPPRVEFFKASTAGPGWIAVFVDDAFAGVMSPEKFAEMKARLKEAKTDG